MSDRRRVNGPAGPTSPPSYGRVATGHISEMRSANGIRAVYLKTGVTPSASGSAYLEMEHTSKGFGMKLTCTVHGPRSLPRSAPFSPHMLISTHVKYAPFSTQHRRGYLQDSVERDMSTHLQAALRGTVIADRWPKSGVDVVISIVEGEVARHDVIDGESEQWDNMNVLSGCITIASAAIADAGIDCVDIMSGGVAALVAKRGSDGLAMVLDPSPSEDYRILAACCVAYLPNRDEITSLWLKGHLSTSDATIHMTLVANAIHASKGVCRLIPNAIEEQLNIIC